MDALTLVTEQDYGISHAARSLDINPKRVQYLMQQMGIMVLYPKANASRPGKGHTVYF